MKFRLHDIQSCSLSFEMTIIITLSTFSICLTNRAASRRFCSLSFEFRSFILMIRRKIMTFFQKKKCSKQMIIIMSRDLHEQTNKHCLKSSQKHIILSSKETIFFTSQMSEKIRLTISISYFRCMKVSFQNINFAVFKSVVRSVLFLMLQML